jgi:hypothetical protein
MRKKRCICKLDLGGEERKKGCSTVLDAVRIPSDNRGKSRVGRMVEILGGVVIAYNNVSKRSECNIGRHGQRMSWFSVDRFFYQCYT